MNKGPASNLLKGTSTHLHAPKHPKTWQLLAAFGSGLAAGFANLGPVFALPAKSLSEIWLPVVGKPRPP